MAYKNIFWRLASKRRKRADRRAGRVPHVGRQPRARTKGGRWIRKRKDAGKKRKPKLPTIKW